LGRPPRRLPARPRHGAAFLELRGPLHLEQKKSKKQQTPQETKEIKLKPNTDEHDFNVRLKQTNEFLKEGHKVKITIFHKGRQAVHPELGKEQLDRLLNSCDPHKVVQEPNMEGKKLSITIVENIRASLI
jgi:translation initiation factor IF-3